MKTLKIILLSTLFLAGCKKDTEVCQPKTNTTIRFNLMDVADNDVFTPLVDHVELFIYDLNGRQISRSTVSKSELNLFAGKRLKLNPGTYTVVAWANTTPERSSLVTDDAKSYLDRTNNYLLNAMAVGGVVENGDPLYYAPKPNNIQLRFTVPAEGGVEVLAEMRHAHVKLEITVEGYDNVIYGVSDMLKMEVTDLTSRYGFGMEPHGNKVSYVQNVPIADTEKKVFNTMFNIPIFDKNTDTDVRISNSKGNLIVPAISLKELLGDKINIEKLWHLPIRIIFTEENGLIKVTVKVDLPEWNEEIVQPNV